MTTPFHDVSLRNWFVQQIDVTLFENIEVGVIGSGPFTEQDSCSF